MASGYTQLHLKVTKPIRVGNFLYYMGSFVRVDANLRVASNSHSRYFGEGPIRSRHLTTMTTHDDVADYG